MRKVTQIAHPLKNRTGTSQRTRIIDALNLEAAPIDGKTLADRLYIISNYATYINFYEYINDAQGEYQKIDTWTAFFSNSLPFQLAKLSKISVEQLEQQFLILYNELLANPSNQALESVFSFIYDKQIVPTHLLYQTIIKAENSFAVPLLSILQSSFRASLVTYIALYNASVTFLCICKKNFSAYMAAPWKLKVDEIYDFDDCIKDVKKGKKEAYLIAAETLKIMFYQMLSGVQEMVDQAPQFIEESLHPLEKSLQQQHQAHLALLFTFLELLKHFQGNINTLGKKHLDFFYQQVLKMVPKKEVTDKAHIIFEIAKHLDSYRLEKDLLLKDGKDANKQDIQFGLDDEIIIDKAQIKEVRTLALPLIAGEKKYIEGVYISPVANSMDGLGKKFKEGLANNWSTLGSKSSKLIEEGNAIANEHPKARLGFVLASPVLLLQEGKRTITIHLECKLLDDSNFTPFHFETEFNNLKTQKAYFLTEAIQLDCIKKLSLKNQEYINALLLEKSPYPIHNLEAFLTQTDIITCIPIFSKQEQKDLCQCIENEAGLQSKSIFNIAFSGEKEWVVPKPKDHVTVEIKAIDEVVKITLKVVLDEDDPMVVFYDQEVLKENFSLEKPFPLVKIETNPQVKIKNNSFHCGKLSVPQDENNENDCCLKKKPVSDKEIEFSLYHYLRQLTLVNAHINVEVCGVKNVIVQNDDNLQDVNKPIFPFGPRPKVGKGSFVDGGANFYIGSKEVFCKNWEKFWINMEWKDKPADLEEHYKFYSSDDPFEDGTYTIEEDSFKYRASILQDGIWKSNTENNPPNNPPNYKLFTLFESHNEVDKPCVNRKNDATFCQGINGPFTEGLSYLPKSMPIEPLETLTVNTRKGFARLTLAGVSFQHEIFTYVLTKQMMALADLVDPQSVANAIKGLEETKQLATKANELIVQILIDINEIKRVAGLVRNQIGGAVTLPLSVVNLVALIKTEIDAAKAILSSNPNIATIHLNNALGNINSISTKLGNLSTPKNSSKAQGRIRKIVDLANKIKENITKSPVAILFQPLNLDNISEFYIEHFLNGFGLQPIVKSISTKINLVLNDFNTSTDLGLPKEPYTPQIKSLSIDYKAIAEKDDIEIIHLYPYENTSKQEDIAQNPTLFPYFDDEGTLFIGIEELSPSSNLSLLFQLAEATADSEQDRAKIDWYYLTNNQWIPLRTDFEIISDATDGLTVSGIVTIAIPDAISKINNTVMPSAYHWIKVATKENVKAIAETIAIHTQAVKTSARLNSLNDKNRLENQLEAGSIAKLVESDFSVKKVMQPFASFDGRKPEIEGHFYTRISEHLKHKGRALMLNDYEKIVLEAFPKIYKTKCISHTLGLSANTFRRDLAIAPGHVVIAVIPDLVKLKAGNELEPKAPLSLLEKIETHLRKKTSPFANLRVMNPRYESVNVHIKARLYQGKDINFYGQKLKEDITFFLAPWFLGDTEKLAFGEEILFSDIVGFIEQLDYVDFIADLCLGGECEQTGSIIQPLTSRSILTAGEICVEIDNDDCLESKAGIRPNEEEYLENRTHGKSAKITV